MFKKLSADATLPTRATAGSVGYDLIATEREWSDSHDTVTYGTGIGIQDIPEGHFAAIFPRSSIVNTDLRLANSVGVIDPDYPGEILVKFDVPKVSAHVLSRGNARIYSVGDKIAQVVILPFFVGGEIVTVQREGGFGSTDTKKASDTPIKPKRGRSER